MKKEDMMKAATLYADDVCKLNRIFKKLEKVGEPLKIYNRLVLKVKADAYKCMRCCFYSKGKCELTMQECEHYDCGEENKFIELKQTKEDMEERKLIELLSEKVHNAWMKEKEAQGFSYGKDYDKEKKKHPDMLPYNELKEEVKEYDRATVRAVLQAQKELQSKYNYNNLKSFDLEAAKAGKPVCTRDGRKARIICFDRDWDMHIVALVSDPLGESVHYYLSNGKVDFDKQNDEDLMMLPEKRIGWINVNKDAGLFKSKEEAERDCTKDYATVRVEFEI